MGGGGRRSRAANMRRDATDIAKALTEQSKKRVRKQWVVADKKSIDEHGVVVTNISEPKITEVDQ